ncbi:MAG: transcriptional repressor LexA [Bacillaceae bacterium]
METLSNKQIAILEYIKTCVLEKGYPPSIREIGEKVGLASSSTVHGHLARLEKKGYIRRDPTKPRAIEILDPLEKEYENVAKQQAIHVPLIGKVTAGLPITAVENVEEFFPIPNSFSTDAKDMFILEISGESMINAGILDGDYVIVRQQSTATNGDIVVAMTTDNEATVKRFYKEKNHFRLQPENDHLEPIILQEVSILGKVVGVFRNIH